MKMACYTHITSPAGGASSLSLVSPNWPTYSTPWPRRCEGRAPHWPARREMEQAAAAEAAAQRQLLRRLRGPLLRLRPPGCATATALSAVAAQPAAHRRDAAAQPPPRAAGVRAASLAAGGLLLALLAARPTDGLHASGFKKTGRGASERHKDWPWLNKALFLEIRCFWLFLDSAGVGGVRRHL